MSGSLRIVGIGPGPACWITPEVTQWLGEATDLIGYAPYLARLSPTPEQTIHASDNRVEAERARLALALAAEGRAVAVVSGGDPGVFAMASAVFEAVETGDPGWRDLDIAVAPGITAMLAAAARLGAPLGHDFCAINLSDNLKPWPVIARRLNAAAAGDFVIALYNPASRARPDGLAAALDLLRGVKGGETAVIFARAIGRADEMVRIATLTTADPAWADMSTLVMIGSDATRTIARASGALPFVYTPRHALA